MFVLAVNISQVCSNHINVEDKKQTLRDQQQMAYSIVHKNLPMMIVVCHLVEIAREAWVGGWITLP